jgi:hypothetical protein
MSARFLTERSGTFEMQRIPTGSQIRSSVPADRLGRIPPPMSDARVGTCVEAAWHVTTEQVSLSLRERLDMF